jgi:hypothetical protein
MGEAAVPRCTGSADDWLAPGLLMLGVTPPPLPLGDGHIWSAVKIPDCDTEIAGLPGSTSEASWIGDRAAVVGDTPTHTLSPDASVMHKHISVGKRQKCKRLSSAVHLHEFHKLATSV